MLHLSALEVTIAATGARPRAIRQRGRRAFDIIAAVLLLIATSPLLAAAAIAIRHEDRGPVFYRQHRVGFHGRPFTLLKLRTMRSDAERYGARYATADDRRITKVGRFLRRNRLDELPQLSNVLAGSMSLIGPRPERPEFTGWLARGIAGYERRLAIKPGITGLAQVEGGYAATLDEARKKLALDLWYIDNRSLLLDARILLRTIAVVVSGRGAR